MREMASGGVRTDHIYLLSPTSKHAMEVQQVRAKAKPLCFFCCCLLLQQTLMMLLCDDVLLWMLAPTRPTKHPMVVRGTAGVAATRNRFNFPEQI